MSAEIHYSRVEMSGDKGPIKGPEGPAVLIPESFFEAVKRERPDGLNWDRIEAAVAVLRGEKEAVAPKPPEPEPTESQKFWRDVYRSGKLTPYQNERPNFLTAENLKKVGEAWKNPQSQGETSRIMAVDLAIRGGADKEYNQLGSLEHRAKRIGALALNTVPSIALDIATSIPYNLGELALTKVFSKQLETVNALPDENKDKKKNIDRLKIKINSVKTANRIIGIANDKGITAHGDSLMQKRTGEKGWLTGEASDKLNDLLAGAFGDYLEDGLNGPTIESLFRAVFQIPVVGAVVEQGWTRWTIFQSKTAYHKGYLKGMYAGVGLLIGLSRDINEKKNRTPSYWIANKLWDGGEAIYKKFFPPQSKVA